MLNRALFAVGQFYFFFCTDKHKTTTRKPDKALSSIHTATYRIRSIAAAVLFHIHMDTFRKSGRLANQAVHRLLRIAEFQMSLHKIINREVVLPVVEPGTAPDDLIKLDHRINGAHQNVVASPPPSNVFATWLKSSGSSSRSG